jgi:photosystem II stability/assembly factor-like uncharacterized protein
MNGPPGGMITQLIQNRDNYNELYAVTPHSIYKSVNKGENWQVMDQFNGLIINSIAHFEDKLFVCGKGLYYSENGGSVDKILDIGCDSLAITDTNLFFTSYSENIRDFQIYYVNLTSESFSWKNISPSVSELSDLLFPTDDTGLYHFLKCSNIVALGNRILASITVEIEGSGELTNGHLYISEDFGITWSKVDLDKTNDLIISKIVQERGNPEHLVLTLKHNIIQAGRSPVSLLLKESFDGGTNWVPVTNLTVLSNGITDVDIIGSSYYLPNPFDDYILRLEGSNYQIIDMPRIKEYEEITFNLDTLLFDFENPDIVYGKTGSVWALGILKSENNMKTWSKMDGDIVASSPTIVVTHPTDPNIVFTSGNVIQESYVTKDGGTTWEPFSPVSAGDEVKIDPHNPNHILLVDEMTGIYESYDLGKTFEKINKGFSSAKVSSFEVAQDGSEKIYVSNLGTGISRYVPSLGTWHYMTNSPDYAYDIKINPEDSDIFFATYSPKVFENHSSVWRYSRSQETNNGWSEILRVEDSKGITSLEFDRTNPNDLYAGVVGKRGTIYYSNNKGDNWQRLNDNFTFVTVHEMVIDPNKENIVYAAPWGGGLFKSVDSGNSWTELITPTISIASIIVDPSNSSHLVVGDRTKPNIYESFNQGHSWRTVVALDVDEYYRISSMILHKEKLYFSAFKLVGGSISLFVDDPMSGTAFKLEGDEPVALAGEMNRSVLSFYSNYDKLYAVSHIKGIYVLEGNEWKDISTSLPDMGFNNLIIDDSTLYVAGGCDVDLRGNRRIGNDSIVNNIYKSSDDGQTWIPLLRNNPFSSGIKKLLQHPKNKDTFFAATGTGLYVSSDKGENWRDQNSGLDFKNIGSMVIGENSIYVGTLGGGVYSGTINTENSINWSETTGPYPRIYNIQIKTDPTQPNIIYTSSYPGGVFKSVDNGVKWTECNFALPSFEVLDPTINGYYSLEVDPNNTNIIYLGIFGKGVYKSYNGAGVWIPMYGKFGQNNDVMRRGITQIKVDPSNSSNLYMGTDNGVYFSNDGAENWVTVNEGLKTLDVRSLRIINQEIAPFRDDFEDGDTDGWNLESGWSISQENGNNFLEGTGHYWAKAGSKSWVNYDFETKIKLIEGGVHINFRVNDDGRYFLGFGEFELYLDKQSSNWNKIEEITRFDEHHNLNQWYDLKIVLRGQNIKIFLNDVLKIDYTDSDQPHPSGSIAFESLDSHIYVDDVIVNITSSGPQIYAGTGGYGLYRHNSFNGAWINIGRTLGGGWWSAWERRMYQFSSVLFHPLISGKIYLGHFPSGFFVSMDNRSTWKDSSLGLGNDGIFSLSFQPHNSTIIWGGSYNGVVKSTDGGKTWKMKSNGIPPEQWPYTVAINKDNPDVMYTSTKNGQNKGFCHRNDFCGVVMKSTDGGESWFKIMNGLDERSEFYSLLISPFNTSILFLSTSDGVYLSRDAGNSWQGINNGLPETRNQVRDNVADNLVITPDNKYLVLGLMEYGVWKADLSGINITDTTTTTTQTSTQISTQKSTNQTSTTKSAQGLSFSLGILAISTVFLRRARKMKPKM